jgi:hypothetical protein
VRPPGGHPLVDVAGLAVVGGDVLRAAITELGEVRSGGEGTSRAGHDDAGAGTHLVADQGVSQFALERGREGVQLLLAAQLQDADRVGPGDVN